MTPASGGFPSLLIGLRAALVGGGDDSSSISSSSSSSSSTLLYSSSLFVSGASSSSLGTSSSSKTCRFGGDASSSSSSPEELRFLREGAMVNPRALVLQCALDGRNEAYSWQQIANAGRALIQTLAPFLKVETKLTRDLLRVLMVLTRTLSTRKPS